MLENLAPILKAGVTDVLLSSSGTLSYRQFGRWAVSPSPDAVKELLAGVVAELAAQVPELQRAISEGRECEIAHVVSAGEAHRIRVLGSMRSGPDGKAIELAMRVHPVKSPVKPSEVSDFVRAIADRRAGLFLVSGAFGKTTLLHAIFQNFVRSNERRTAVVRKMPELELEEGKIAAYQLSGSLSDGAATKAKSIGAEAIFVFDDASNASAKHRLAVLASQTVVIASAPGADATSTLMNWAEEYGTSPTLLSHVFAGVASFSLVGDGSRFRHRIEKYVCDSDNGAGSVFRSNLSSKNWKMVGRAIAPGSTEIQSVA